MRRPLDLSFPRQHGWPRVALAVSILLHLLVLLGSVDARLPYIKPPEPQLIALPPAPPTAGAPDAMVYLMPREQGVRPGRPRQETGTTGVRQERKPVSTEPVTPLPMHPAPADTGGVATARRRGFIPVAPAYGEGLLWVRPVPVSPQDLAKHLERSHFQQVDSAVTIIMQAFLDSLDAERGAAQARLPDWTTNLAGKKFGVDSRYIYIAGLKIPAAVLALLPLPQGGVDQSHALDHIMDLRADIEQAARRAENMDEFKRAIREIRERKQRERDFERAQRETPPPPPPEDAPQP